MLAPDVDIQDGKGTILISSEEGETDSEWTCTCTCTCTFMTYMYMYMSCLV